MVFRHRKCFGGTGYLSGHRKGVSGTPGKDMGLMVQVREHTSPQGAGAPPIGPAIWGGKERRGGEGKYEVGLLLPSRSPSFLSPLSKKRKGGGRIGGGPQVGFLLLGAPLAAPLPLPPIYTWGGGA